MKFRFKLTAFFLLLVAVTSLSAQSNQAQERAAVIATLSQGSATDSLNVSDEVLNGAHGTPPWYLDRGYVYLSAAIAAKDNQNLGRVSPLVQAAQSDLLNARASNALSSSAHSRCAQQLGTIAERFQGDLAAAATYYQEAVNNDPTNRAATDALARVRSILRFRQSLNH